MMYCLQWNIRRPRLRRIWRVVRISLVLGVIVAAGAAAERGDAGQEENEATTTRAEDENTDTQISQERRLDVSDENQDAVPARRCACGPKGAKGRAEKLFKER
jgi:hypothetical protein